MRKCGLLLAASLATLPAALLAQAPANAPAANWERIAACAEADSAEARHGCIDAVLRQAGLLDPAQEAAQARESFGESARIARRQDTPPVQASAPAGPAPSPAPAELDELATTISNSLFASDRKLVLFTPEGSVWKQSDGAKARFLPRKGELLTITRTALGGFRCKLGQSRVFRCERLQ